MNSPLRRRLRHTRRWAAYFLLVLVIGLAVIVGIANQLLPLVERHPQRVAAWLSERVGEKVGFSAARAEWTRRGPRFTLDDLQVGEGNALLSIGSAQLQVAMYSGLLPGRPLTELKIRDLSLTLVQRDDGSWEVIGLPGRGDVDLLERLEGFGELHIEKTQLTISAPALRIDSRIPRVDARIRVNGSRLRVGVAAWSRAGDEPLNAVLDFGRDSGDGLLWVGADNLQLAHWAPLLSGTGVLPQQGNADLGLWARLRDRRVSQVILEADVRQALLRSVRPLLSARGRTRAIRVDFERVQARIRWMATANGWQVHAPRLSVTRAGKVARLDGLMVDVGRQYRLLGEALDLSPLAAVLSLHDQLPDSLRLLLQQTRPQAVLHGVSIQGWRHGPMRGSLRVAQLGLKSYARRPGFSGMAGRIEFDERGGVMTLASDPVHFEWPGALRQPLDLQPGGALAWWTDGPGWNLGTDALRLHGALFSATARIHLAFQGDGSAPRLDLAADLGPSSFDSAKKLWILHKMPASTVQWLDAALLHGDVVDGRIVMGGDLDDWPFRGGAGSLDARASVRNATLKFNQHWPAAENIALDVAFNGPGMAVTGGKGSLLGNQIQAFSGGIAEFRTPWLDLQVASEGHAQDLSRLMLATPLAKDYGEHLRAASIQGNSAVDLSLRLPLRPALGERSIAGTLDLEGATVADSRWDIDFTDVSGRTHFTHGGFHTDDLRVKYADQPAVFNLRVGSSNRDSGTAALASLEGRFRAPTLLARYPDLAWLEPVMKGRSDWHVEVSVPVGAKSAVRSSQIRLRSDLKGTAIDLPAPLRKSEASSLPFELQAALPVDRGHVDLRLGSLMRLQARMRTGAPINGVIQFGDGNLSVFPRQGLSVRGTVPVLDATGWVAFAGGGKSRSPLNDVDVQAAQLVFLDRPFADTRLQMTRAATSTELRLRGEGIDGSVEIPGNVASGVRGRFARLHLPSVASAGAAATASSGQAATLRGPTEPGGERALRGMAEAPDDVPAMDDPSRLPPLRFSISDLRIGPARLGKAELVTAPTADGLHVEKFQTQAKDFRLDASGSWVRKGSGTRSNFRVNFIAGSLGQMLDAFGYSDVVRGGSTKATLIGGWPGSPGALTLANFEGRLSAEVGEGRLLDVEPGGSGRVLGLLSLAEIPRRLSLDFSDFFEKGFAFNTAKGDFSFADGKAVTDNLRIDGPAAEIRVSGTTGLREQVYDQRVEVLPKAGGLLPAIGLLAAGPAGAALGAVAQAVLQRPLKQSTRVLYRVTGRWSKPQVIVVERGPRRAAAASDVPAAAAVRP